MPPTIVLGLLHEVVALEDFSLYQILISSLVQSIPPQAYRFYSFFKLSSVDTVNKSIVEVLGILTHWTRLWC